MLPPNPAAGATRHSLIHRAPNPAAGATRHSLIHRACNLRDESAWLEFDRIYRRFILFVLGSIGIERDDLEDLTQQVMLALTRDLPGYNREKAKFRTWLSAVIRHAAGAHLRRKRTDPASSGTPAPEPLLAAWQEDASDLDQRIEAEWSTYVSNLAMDRVRGHFLGKAIEVFELGLDGVPQEEICRRTGLTPSSAYTLRKRVKKRLILEIRSLVNELEA
jgi:RNA polymerase sigma factor (sigma-70 family)